MMAVFVAGPQNGNYPDLTLLPDVVIDTRTTPLLVPARTSEQVSTLAFNASQWAASSPSVALPAQSHPAGHHVRLPVFCEVLTAASGGGRTRLAPGSILRRSVAVTLGIVS